MKKPLVPIPCDWRLPARTGNWHSTEWSALLGLVTSPDVHDEFLVCKTITVSVIDVDRSRIRLAAELANGANKRILRWD